MGRRKTWSVLAVALSVAGLAACAPAAASPGPTSDAGAVSALVKLHGWLNRPGSANLNIYAFETSGSTHPVSTALQLSGPADVATGAVQLTGQQRVVGGGPITQVEAVAAGGMLYSTVPPRGDTALAQSSPSKWTRTAMSSVRPGRSRHSAWWLALQYLNAVHRDGDSVVSTKGATEYTGTVDLAKVPGIPASFLKAPLFRKADTTRIAVDLYTNSGTGDLMRLTYRFGLGASIDSTAVGQSTAGFQVDLYLWDPGTPTPVSNPVLVPAAKDLIPGGNDDLCRLLIF